MYAVETPDHAYNFVILPGGQIYLIDSNEHIFRQIRTLADFEATGHNATLADGYDYNYGDPEEDDDTDMDFYHWGALAARWHVLLTQTRGQVWFNNGARQQVRTTALGSKTLD